MQGTVDRIEEDKIVIKLIDGQELIWPKQQNPDLKEGQVINLNLQTDEKGTIQKQQLAKDVLNEILTQE